ncbi:MAG TPA: DNA methyltransferase [Ktedonobacteraceae bacterium]|nr:DNA methyltransferase [Ktedonobacteraceae bacterium]
MIQDQTHSQGLEQLLASYSDGDNDFWSFRDRAEREHAHAYFQYPAMMVPKMQGKLIEAVKKTIPDTKHVFDPFVGSGTTMTEAMMLGLDFTGQDINPLAVLLCRAKMGPFHNQILQEKLESIITVAKKDKNSQIDIDFPGRDKWFQQKIAIELSQLRRSILDEQELWCRRFCWVALAETIRLASNSRTSTFKLHIRPLDDVNKREAIISPINLFETIVKRNLDSLSNQKQLLDQQGLIEQGQYKGYIEIRHKDSAKSTDDIGLYDLLITSPPYGDNLTTVPYGQHSFLPLQWINLNDIDENIDKGWIKTTQEIDRRSLGGSNDRALEDTRHLCDQSESFSRIMEELKNEPRDRSVRVAAFCRDLNSCIDPILTSLKSNAYMLWTVGNRRVGNRPVPIDQILIELLNAHGATLVTKLQRTIPTKRMAVRNSSSSTMRAEVVLIMKKGGI